MRRRTGQRLGAMAAALAVLAACGDTTDPVSAGPSLPEPSDLARMDRSIQAQYAELRQALDDALAAPDATPAERGEAWGRLGMWGHTYREPTLAGAAYARARAAAPDEFRWHYYTALLQLRKGDTDAARRSLRRSLQLRPRYAPGLIRLAEIELEAGRLDAARGWFQRALDTQRRSARALFGLGLISLQEGDAVQAIKRLEAALAIAPEASGVQYNLGLAYRKLGDDRRAQKHLRRTEGRSGDRKGQDKPPLRDPLARRLTEMDAGARSLRQRARRAIAEGRPERAVALLRDAVASQPDSVAMRSDLADALRRSGDVEGAAAALEEALRLDPKHTRSHLELARMLERRGPKGAGEARFRAALESDPENAEANFAVGVFELDAGRLESAQAHFARAVAGSRDDTGMRARRVQALLDRGQWLPAAEALQADRAAHPDDPLLLSLHARLLASAPDASLRDGPQALDLAREALAHSSRLYVAETVAMAHAEVGDLDRAVAWQRAAVDAAASADGERLGWVAERLSLYESGKPNRTPVLATERLGSDVRVEPPAG